MAGLADHPLVPAAPLRSAPEQSGSRASALRTPKIWPIAGQRIQPQSKSDSTGAVNFKKSQRSNSARIFLLGRPQVGSVKCGYSSKANPTV